MACTQEQNLTFMMTAKCSCCLKITPGQADWIHAYCCGWQILVQIISCSALRLCLWRETRCTTSQESPRTTNL